jgi:hypothetical protein
LPPPKVCRRIAQYHALLGSPSAEEAATARDKLIKLLAKQGLSWNDLPEILADISSTASTPSRKPPPTSAPQVNVLSLVLHLIEKYGVVTADERMALTLWCLHTYVFDRFAITPRLALLSPVRGCGKTTMLRLLELLIDDTFRSDHVTPPAIYHTLNRNPRATLLLDEVDNLDLQRNTPLRALFNAGHSQIELLDDGHLSTCNKHRRHGAPHATKSECGKQHARSRLSRTYRRRFVIVTAYNWRPLLAIADDLGMGQEARDAAIALSANRPDEDVAVTLLKDLRKIFDALPPWRWGMDRAPGAYLVEALLNLEDSFWAEYRGVNDDQLPRNLTQSQLAQLLRPFGIRPKTIWPTPRRPDDRSAPGYLRSQFEATWASYCSETDTPTQSSKIIHLPRS